MNWSQLIKDVVKEAINHAMESQSEPKITVPLYYMGRHVRDLQWPRGRALPGIGSVLSVEIEGSIREVEVYGTHFYPEKPGVPAELRTRVSA